MTTHGPARIAATSPACAPTPAPAAGAEDTARFRRLLESLEQLAKEHRTAPPVTDAGSVQAAVARADAGFSLAMDLRRQLEEAFRLQLP